MMRDILDIYRFPFSPLFDLSIHKRKTVHDTIKADSNAKTRARQMPNECDINPSANIPSPVVA